MNYNTRNILETSKSFKIYACCTMV